MEENNTKIIIKSLNLIIGILLMNSVIFGLIYLILDVFECSLGLIINLIPAFYIMFFIKPYIKLRLLINKSYKTATKIITENIDKLHIMSDTLMQYETIDRDQIDDIMMGVKPRPPKDWDNNDQNNNKSLFIRQNKFKN